ncbi:MAG TPA: hypothetical protein VJ850_11035 [Candidatus Limnocylindrales bacterium]|nr:hypothetical protein [Candidatus Limnocylindrales bacterium]
MKFADGTPATNAQAWGTPYGKYFGYMGTTVAPGQSLLTFDKPGTYCIWFVAGGDADPGYPNLTYSSSGTLILNSDDTSNGLDANPTCATKVKTASRVIDIVFAPFINVSGTAVHKDGTPCGARVWATSSKMSASTDAYQQGKWTLHLLPAKWTIRAIDSDNEYGPRGPSSTATVSTSEVDEVSVTCGGAG